MRDIVMARLRSCPALGIAALVIAQWATPVNADTWGVYGTELSRVDLIGLGSQVDSYQTPGGIQPQMSLDLPSQFVNFAQPIPGFESLTEAGLATASGFMSDGILHGFVSADANNVAFLFNGNLYSSNASGNLSELWLDQISVSGPAGTVQLQVTDHFSGSLFFVGLTPPSTTPLDAYSQLNLYGGSGVFCDTNCTGGGFDNRYDTQMPRAFDFTDTFLLSVTAGDTYTLEEQLILSAYAGYCCGPTDAYADALNTSFLTIEVLTPGASISTASGVSYLPNVVSVPEPATLALFGIGLAGLGFTRNRRSLRTRGDRARTGTRHLGRCCVRDDEPR